MLHLPRLIIAGAGGDSGKTLAALGLAAFWRRKGIAVATFKKGPDYIDPAWLTLASGRQTRNLDTWLMGEELVRREFARNSVVSGVNLIEGNRGLHDGLDERGTHSTAALAKILQAPTVVVLPVAKMTRTAAALALGLRRLDEDVPLAGFILNRCATQRQSEVIKRAVEAEVGLPVLGNLPILPDDPLPGRHLGLVTPQEHSTAMDAVHRAELLIAENVDIERLEAVAQCALPMDIAECRASVRAERGHGCRIGVFQGSAFTFYYPDNLEALREAGAELIPINPLRDVKLPELDGLYIGGGFPETHASQLADNEPLRRGVRQAAEVGMPIWAECGGLIYLSRSLVWQGREYPMAGVFPIEVVLSPKPAGHGYMSVLVEGENPFLPAGTVLKGHEFHYSTIHGGEKLPALFSVKRGVGLGGGRDGLLWRSTIGCYLHLHAAAAPRWAPGFVSAAAAFKGKRCASIRGESAGRQPTSNSGGNSSSLGCTRDASLEKIDRL